MTPALHLPIPTCWGPPEIKRIEHGKDLLGSEVTVLQVKQDGDWMHLGTQYSAISIRPACLWTRLDLTEDASLKYLPQ